jgi:hypothetical protein
MNENIREGDKAPLPRYAMPDRSAPEYEAILERIQDERRSMIGSAFFYIRTGSDEEICLCRIIPGGRKIFFHEIIDHRKYGISDEDLHDAQKDDPGIFSLPGFVHISPHIEMKLRALLDAE